MKAIRLRLDTGVDKAKSKSQPNFTTRFQTQRYGNPASKAIWRRFTSLPSTTTLFLLGTNGLFSAYLNVEPYSILR